MDPKDEIKEKVDIVGLIGEYVKLKKAGKNFKALCPFHKEKTPSFMVSPDRQSWKCFGCSKGGDVYSFLMEMEGMDFPEALRTLGAKVGVEVRFRHARPEQQSLRERILAVNALAESFFHTLLLRHPSAARARAYLKKRGIQDAVIRTFKLGYAPDGWETTKHALRKKGFSEEELLRAGLLVPGQRGGYDRFRNRLTFPLHDVHGSVLGFAGRTLTGESAKYVNTPETPVFTKGKLLFGLDITKHEIRSTKQAILVEGETDVILAYQAKTRNVVGVKGTALTDAQVALIKRYTEEAVVCFDADAAGREAMLRGIEQAHNQGLAIRVMRLPRGLDPADAIQKDQTIWTTALETTQPMYDFWIETILSHHNIQEAAGKKHAVAQLIPVFRRMESSIERDHYVQRLAALLQIDSSVLRQQLNPSARAVFHPADHPPARPRQQIQDRALYFFALLAQAPTIVPKDIAGVTAAHFSDPSHQALFDLIARQLQEYNRVETKTLVEQLPPHLGHLGEAIMFYAVPEDIDRSAELAMVKRALRHAYLRKQLRETARLLKTALARAATKEAQNYEQKISKLTHDLQTLYR